MATNRPNRSETIIKRSEQDLLEALRQQFELLKNACAGYDGGKDLEVLNIATRLRVILHGPGSLVSQLRLAKRLRFRDTSTHRLDPERNICVANIGLKLTVGVGAKWIPLLDGWPEGHPKPTRQPLNIWWGEAILPSSSPDGLDRTPQYARRDLVLAIANQDGGAHVGHRDANYDRLTKDHFTYKVARRTAEGETSFSTRTRQSRQRLRPTDRA